MASPAYIPINSACIVLLSDDQIKIKKNNEIRVSASISELFKVMRK